MRLILLGSFDRQETPAAHVKQPRCPVLTNHRSPRCHLNQQHMPKLLHAYVATLQVQYHFRLRKDVSRHFVN